MKKYNKEEIMNIVLEAQIETMQAKTKTDDKTELDKDHRFFNMMMDMKDMALLSLMVATIEDKLK